jgi:hypothetical protein
LEAADSQKHSDLKSYSAILLQLKVYSLKCTFFLKNSLA